MGGETRVSDDLVQRAGHAARGLAPGYFALVMASAIIFLGPHLEGFAGPFSVLLWVCAGSFVVLATLTVLRLVGYRTESPATSPTRAGRSDFGELWLALGVWVLVFAAMTRRVWRTVVVGPSQPPQELLRD